MAGESNFVPLIKDEAIRPSDRPGRLVDWLVQHWFFVISLLLAVFAVLPWLAPLFMELGWTRLASSVYAFYSTQCHQLPQRSYFLFGAKPTYSLGEIQAAWHDTNNALVLRQFIGNQQMGWKVAWSDRMVAMYGGLLLWGLAYWPLRKRIKPLPWWGVLMVLSPMAIDGISHLISDLMGWIGGGFRSDNAWLAALTDQIFPATFYAGDALGSFNSSMRLATGLLFGLGIVWFLYPRLQAAISRMVERNSI